MFTYLLEASCCSILFYLVYNIFFKSHTNHNFNRFYLLSSIILSFMIPWMEIVTSVKTVIQEAALSSSVIENTNPEVSGLSLLSLITIIYLVGVTISIIYFLTKLVNVLRMINNGERKILNNQSVVVVREKIAICSFLRSIIVSDSKQDKLSQFEIEHEKAHILQYHSIDIIIAWLYQSIFWFNPIAYFYKKRLMEVHEFLADKKVITNNGKTNYQEYILNVVSQKLQPHLAHNFNSIIKTRLTMMNSNSNPSKWSYGVAIAVLTFTLFLFSCKTKVLPEASQAQSQSSQWVVETPDLNDPRLEWLTETIIDTTVVIDYDTDEEKILIIKTQYEYRMDTIIVFDAETFDETTSIVKTYKGTPPRFKGF